jgi:transketolase C-terminal domain/subunit
MLASRATVIDLPWVSAFDDDWVTTTFGDAGTAVLIDDHSTVGGMGERLAARIATLGIGARVRLLGVDGIPECGQPAEVLAHHGLDRASLRRVLAEQR